MNVCALFSQYLEVVCSKSAHDDDGGGGHNPTLYGTRK